jgi:hypothetical protein
MDRRDDSVVAERLRARVGASLVEGARECQRGAEPAWMLKPCKGLRLHSLVGGRRKPKAGSAEAQSLALSSPLAGRCDSLAKSPVW